MILMDKKTNEKVINLFQGGSADKKSELSVSSGEKYTPAVKFFAGVNYVRLDEDVNGYPFNKAKLLENAENFSYIVRVLRPKNGKTSIYNYNVPYDKIVNFISMFANNELTGTIIDIDKYKPNDLA